MCVFSHDGSETAVLDFCTLLHTDPELLRLSPAVSGLVLDDDGVVVADECELNEASVTPMEEAKMQQYLHTINMYVNTQEK